ncbi:hypothetical protein LSCM1_05098 [Leishmania martiniquensis]|uniref:Uncharacterized protein n=1 Tax=Leishmania martiniquensis TaxID=1580590 RepID=A0A836KJ63_9TRYP|nr:hypothetical protein LSCM1_05098 [Leishmania martiniquensis]
MGCGRGALRHRRPCHGTLSSTLSGSTRHRTVWLPVTSPRTFEPQCACSQVACTRHYRRTSLPSRRPTSWGTTRASSRT